MKRIAISQSNYLPWAGYFQMIGSVDEFVLYDEVQYTRRDWRNRNRIKFEDSMKWITLAVQSKGRYDQRIDETMLAEEGWADAHWRLIEQAYRKAPHFSLYAAAFEEYYGRTRRKRLSDVNRDLIEIVMSQLGLTTPLHWSTDYPVQPELVDPAATNSDRGEGHDRNRRLIDICVQLGAEEYVSGPAARFYVDEDQFERHGIAVSWFDYSNLAEYPQMGTSFERGVSVVDLLFNTGTEAIDHLALREAA